MTINASACYVGTSSCNCMIFFPNYFLPIFLRRHFWGSSKRPGNREKDPPLTSSTKMRSRRKPNFLFGPTLFNRSIRGWCSMEWPATWWRFLNRTSGREKKCRRLCNSFLPTCVCLPNSALACGAAVNCGVLANVLRVNNLCSKMRNEEGAALTTSFIRAQI